MVPCQGPLGRLMQKLVEHQVKEMVSRVLTTVRIEKDKPSHLIRLLLAAAFCARAFD